MIPKVMQVDNLYNFSLVRYEPQSIILLQKSSRKPYQFYQLELETNLKPQISHPNLLRPILYKNGVLYAKPCESLASLIEARRRDYSPARYSVDELVNTFQPVLDCLDFLHQKGIFYGNISSQHIVFFENGEIYIKDWLFRNLDVNPENVNKIQDMRSIGYLIAQAASLFPADELRKLSSVEIISLLLEFYSVSFCVALIILLQGLSKHYSSVLNLLQSDKNQVRVQQVKSILEEAVQLKNIREKQKLRSIEQNKAKQKQLKQVENEKVKIETPRKEQQKGIHILSVNGSLQGSPTKKFNITTPNKKLIKLEDCENKKVFNQEVKKRQIQKITKIIQRSNAFVNQLMARKNNDRKYLNSAKTNSSLIDAQQNSKKTIYLKQSPKVSSPTKRLRSISKKK